jgi:hypothetical protein
MAAAPARSIQAKSTDLFRKDPSSNCLAYFTRKNMWNTKSSERLPKYKKEVARRQTSPRWKTSLAL